MVVDCGTGVHSQQVAGRFNEVLAIDPDRRLVDHARRHRSRGNLRYEARHLHQVTVGEDGRFDVVIALGLRRHADPVNTVAALRHLRSLTRPEGLLLLTARIASDRTPKAPRRRRAWGPTAPSTAWQEFRADLRFGRQPVRDAIELLQLGRALPDRQDDRALWTRPDWDRPVAPVFHGARVTDLDRTRALSWRAPGPWTVT